MFQSDWLLRQIEMLGVVFERIAKALRDGDAETALALCDDAVGEVLGMDPSLVHSLDGASLTLVVAAGTDGSRRAFMLGEILVARAEALQEADRHTEAASERRRARGLLKAALSDAEEDVASRIREVLEWLDGFDA